MSGIGSRIRTITSTRAARALIVGGAIVPAVAMAACDDDTGVNLQETEDAGTGGTDASQSTDAPVNPATDSGSDASAAGPQPVILSLPGVTGHARLFNVAYSASGGIYAVGQVGMSAANTDLGTVIVKLLPSGALDSAFGNQGVVIKNVVSGGAAELARGIVVQSDGKIVVSGVVEHDLTDAASPTRDVYLLRFNANGTPDNGWGDQGILKLVFGDGAAVSTWGLAKYANDDLLVTSMRKYTGPLLDDGGAPAPNEAAIARLNGQTGAYTAFGQPQDAGAGTTTDGGTGVFRLNLASQINARNCVVLPDGKALIAGYTPLPAGNRPIIIKLTAEGLPDTSFGVNGIFFPETGLPGFGTGQVIEAYSAAPQGDKVVTAGYGKVDSTQPAVGWLSLRLNSDGGLDPSYATNGHASFPVNEQGANARAVLVLPDNRVMLIGAASPAKPTSGAPTQSQYGAIAILKENGTLDTSFSTGGPKLFDLGGPATGRAAHFFWGAAVSPDKKFAAVVGIKGGVTANDAGVATTNDQAAVVFVPLTK